MASILRGDNGNFSQGNENGTVDRFGVATMTAQSCYAFDSFASSLLAIGETHPTLTGMEVVKASFRVLPGRQKVEVTYAYEGFIGSVPEPTYEFNGAFGQEPIGTHSDLLTIAGTPASPLNGALWVDWETREQTSDNARGILQGFAFMSGSSRNIFAGVESFEDPRGYWVEYSFSATKPTGAIGTANTVETPSGSPPTFTGRTWKSELPTYQKRGGIYQIRKAWQLSGKGGWIEDIYS